MKLGKSLVALGIGAAVVTLVAGYLSPGLLGLVECAAIGVVIGWTLPYAYGWFAYGVARIRLLIGLWWGRRVLADAREIMRIRGGWDAKTDAEAGHLRTRDRNVAGLGSDLPVPVVHPENDQFQGQPPSGKVD